MIVRNILTELASKEMPKDVQWSCPPSPWKVISCTINSYPTSEDNVLKTKGAILSLTKRESSTNTFKSNIYKQALPNFLVWWYSMGSALVIYLMNIYYIFRVM